MMTWLLLSLLAAGPNAVQEADSIEKSIVDLGDENASVRETALQAIIAAGPPAIRRARAASGSRARCPIRTGA